VKVTGQELSARLYINFNVPDGINFFVFLNITENDCLRSAFIFKTVIATTYPWRTCDTVTKFRISMRGSDQYVPVHEMGGLKNIYVTTKSV
jgi:hypothetical protein